MSGLPSYYQRNRLRLIDWQMDYNDAHSEQRRVYMASWFQLNKARRASYKRDRRRLQWMSAEVWPFFVNRLPDEDTIMQAVNNAVPKTIPEQWRQDVCQDLVLAVLEGEVAVGEIGGAVKKYIARAYRNFGSSYVVSLDAPIRGFTDLLLRDTLAVPA